MRRIELDKQQCRVHFKTDGTVPNAVRRALMCDVQNYAPDSVTIRKNTSCQTDEYVAHRIGLIPFVDATEDTVATLMVSDRTATTDDFVGVHAFRPMPIMKLATHQTLDVDVRFRKATGADHTRFSHITNVAYANDDENQTLSFEIINAREPLGYLLEAVESLIARVDRNVYFVETSYDAQKVTL